MIRINLLPVKEKRRRAAAKKFLYVSAALIVLEIAIFGVFYFIQLDRFEKLEKKVSKVEARLQEVDSVEKEIKTLKSDISKNEKRLNILEDLRKKRTGAFEVTYELQTFLTAPTSERIKIQQRKQNWDATWNPGRVWLESCNIDGEGFELKGLAKTADDVAEFLFRLETSEYFRSPQLDFVTVQEADGATSSIVNFRITGDIKMHPESKKGDST